MSWFSGKDIYTAGVAATSLVDEIPDPIADGIKRAVLQDKPVMPFIMDAIIGGFNVAIDNFYREGDTTYSRGLPLGNIHAGNVVEEDVVDVLEGIIGEPIVLDSVIIDVPSQDHVVRAKLQTTHNLDNSTNILDSDPNYVSEGDDLNHYYYETLNEILGRQRIPTTFAVIHYETKVRIGKGGYTQGTAEYKIEIDTSDIDYKGDYYSVIYHTVANPDRELFWYYRVGQGTYPGLDSSGQDVDAAKEFVADFFPIVPIYINKVPLTDSKYDGTAIQYDTERLLGYLSLDLTQLVDGIQSPENAEGAENIDDVFINISVDIVTDNPYSIEYLYLFFKRLSVRSTINESRYNAWFNATTGKDDLTNAITIEDKEYNMALTYNFIRDDIIEGNVQEVGTYSSEVTLKPDAEKSYRAGRARFLKSYFPRSYITFIYQYSETHYRRIQVHGLQHITKVHDKADLVKKNLESAVAEDKGLYVPVDRAMVEAAFPPNLQQEIYYDGLTLVFYALEKTHVDWYETAAFANLLQFVLIVVAIVTYQPQLAGLTLLEAAVVILESVAIAYAIDFALEKVVDFLGEDLAFLSAVVALVYTAYKVYTGQGLSGTPSAQYALAYANAAFTGITELVTDELKLIQEESEEILELYTDFQEELENAKSGLDTQGEVDPLWITSESSLTMYSETPTNFYTRTVHAKNPGALTLDGISNYADNTLQLPTIDDTINMITRSRTV